MLLFVNKFKFLFRYAAALIMLLAASLGARTFDLEYEALRMQLGQQPIVDVNLARRQERLWRNQSYVEPAIPQPQRARPNDPEQNQRRYIKAHSLYQQAYQKIQNYRQAQAELESQSDLLPEELWWKQIDARAALDRQSKALQLRKSRELVVLSKQGLDWLDQIDNRKLDRSDAVQDLRKALLRIYISHQIQLHQFAHARAALVQMERLPEMKLDWTLHYYFSICEAVRLQRAIESRGVSDLELRQIRRQKNLRRLLAVELRYGTASPEYRYVKTAIAHEELGSPRS